MRGKVAIVTGAAAGIGRGIAEVLFREGCRVTVADWDEAQGERTAGELGASDSERIQFVRTDVSKEADIRRMIDRTLQRWGTVDILVNNVGTHYYRPIEKIGTEDWDRVLATDLRGHFLAIQAVLPQMRSSGGGAIVNIASVHALQSQPHFSVYAAAKGGIVAMSRSLAMECSSCGVRINTVLPGLTRNANVDRSLSGLTPEERQRREQGMAKNIPLGRIAEPTDIGEAVAFLAGDRASFITGTTLVVDGGESAHLSWGN
jgi:NAD(P)-dependent dehydrogenase (short-subunit alcohol dehydrogenase family)